MHTQWEHNEATKTRARPDQTEQGKRTCMEGKRDQWLDGDKDLEGHEQLGRTVSATDRGATTTNGHKWPVDDRDKEMEIVTERPWNERRN